MKLSSLASMPFSAAGAWLELACPDSAAARNFWWLVLPLSLLPPEMIDVAARQEGGEVAAFLDQWPEAFIAHIVFLWEILSFTFMGWMIKHAPRIWGATISFRHAYLLAAIVAVPLWLSSLGLLVDSELLDFLLAGLALLLSCALLFQGLRAFCASRHGAVPVAAITQTVFSSGMLTWSLLLALVTVSPA